MLQGIYVTASGMLPRINQQQTIANNLANQTTTGYKKEQIFLRKLITAQYALDNAKGIERTEVPEDVRVDYTQGTFERTNNTYDVALNGPGFFRVRDAAGNIYYTRNGRFYLDPNGVVMTSNGMFLMDQRNEPITLEGINTKIMGNGEIYEEGALKGTIGVADLNAVDYQSLVSIGSGLFLKPTGITEAPPSAQTLIYQGYIEESNVEPIRSMVDMIEVYRMFELGQKSIQIQDQTLQRVVTEVGAIK